MKLESLYYQGRVDWDQMSPHSQEHALLDLIHTQYQKSDPDRTTRETDNK